MVARVMPRRSKTPCSPAPSTNRPNPSRKLTLMRRSREGTFGILDIRELFMHSYFLTLFEYADHDPKRSQNDSKIGYCGVVFPVGYVRHRANVASHVCKVLSDGPAPVYEVFAIRYASIPDFPVSALI